MICVNINQVYEYYARVATYYANRRLKILKTDTHNESRIYDHSIPLAPILNFGNHLICIEIDKEILARAKHNFPSLNLMLGDIRKLDEKIHYDLLLDFSTIDHVTPEEFPDVLRRYREIAKAVSVVVWLSDTQPRVDKQYYFRNWQFRKTFYEIFGEHNEILLYSYTGASLVHFINDDCLKLEGPSLIEWLNIPNLICENKRADPLIAILNSKSWRITAPLRFLNRLVRKLKENDHANYPWKYAKGLDYRYELVKRHINFNSLHVVDLCSGYAGLYDLVKDDVSSYRACDLWKLHPISEQMADDDFVKTVRSCDVLCAFGHGGYEISGEELESKTLTNSIHFLIKKFSPRWVVLESVDRFFPIISDIASRYQYKESLFKHEGLDWLHNRTMLILGPYKIQVESSSHCADR